MRSTGHRIASFVLALGVAPVARGTPVLAEHFTPPAGTCDTMNAYFPSGWTRFNVDGLTPASDASYVDHAYVVHADCRIDPDEFAAFSTSWYVPPGAADDFMCTPPVALPAQSLLSWRAMALEPAYPDGYDVRVMRVAPSGSTGNEGNLLTASTSVFAVAAEQPAWTPHDLRLDAAGFGAETVYVCFRNHSDDMDRLLVDDVVVKPLGVDVASSAAIVPIEYPIVPAYGGYALARGASLDSVGGLPITNAQLSAQVVANGVDVGPPVTSAPIASMSGTSRQPVTFAGTVPIDAAGSWHVRYRASATESASDADPSNDETVSMTIVAGNDELARDNGVDLRTIGIGAGNGGELGQQFDLPQRLRATGIRYKLGASSDPGWPGKSIVARLRAFDADTMKPGAILAETTAHTAAAGAEVVAAPFAHGDVELPAGRYVVTVVEPLSSTLPLVITTHTFVPMTTWVTWPTNVLGDWSHFEDLGAAYVHPAYARLLVMPTDVLFLDGYE